MATLFDDDPLFNQPEGQRRRDQGMSEVRTYTDRQIQDELWSLWRSLCRKQHELTSDV